MTAKKELHFYPGEKRLLLLVGGAVTLEAEAWGGPAVGQKPRAGEPFGEGPTHAGRFVIWTRAPYQTNTWPWSRIRWGARLKDHPTDSNDLLWEDSRGHWHSVKKTTGLDPARAIVAGRYQDLYGGARTVPATWMFNDFGPLAVRYFKDLNHDGILDNGETLSGEMFHTTPDNEAEEARYRAGHPGSTVDPPVTMYESHGCIHLRPSQRDRLIAAGAFARGMTLVIHGYSETAP